MEAGAYCFQDELKGGSALKLAGGQHGPEALAGGAAAGAARALSDKAIDDHKAQGLFGGVVGGLQSGRGDEDGLEPLNIIDWQVL